jgi:hypothetical protein
MIMYRAAAPLDVHCPCCGSPSNVLGTSERDRGRTFMHCQCSACLVPFDRIRAPNGKGMTTLYAVPSSVRSGRFVRVVPDNREDAHAS